MSKDIIYGDPDRLPHCIKYGEKRTLNVSKSTYRASVQFCRHRIKCDRHLSRVSARLSVVHVVPFGRGCAPFESPHLFGCGIWLYGIKARRRWRRVRPVALATWSASISARPAAAFAHAGRPARRGPRSPRGSATTGGAVGEPSRNVTSSAVPSACHPERPLRRPVIV